MDGARRMWVSCECTTLAHTHFCERADRTRGASLDPSGHIMAHSTAALLRPVRWVQIAEAFNQDIDSRDDIGELF